MDFFSCYASAAFGFEGLVAEELRTYHLRDVRAENGGVRFSATLEELYLCNLRLRYSDRVFLLAAEQHCTSFEDLFQLVFSVPWGDYVRGNEALNFSAHCTRSILMSPRDCQSIGKKAMIEKLKKDPGISHFPENGPAFPVVISIHSDKARIMINMSGNALSRRGYRTWNGEAPIRETLAAALVHLSPWKPGRPVYDPCCGTGTLLIEAAFLAAHRAPGVARPFAMEDFYFCRSLPFSSLRRQVAGEQRNEDIPYIGGSDLDPQAILLASRHVKQAELSNHIHLSVQPLQSLQLPITGGVFLCNPPYGERLSDQASCRKLYRELCLLKDRHPSWSLCAISSDPSFERFFGRRADKKRRLYNGRLECTDYIYL